MSAAAKTEQQVSEAWAELVAYWKRRGDVPPMNQLPGLWEFDMGELWHVKVNGHAEKIDDIAGFHAVAEYNGWPAIVMNPYGGMSMFITPELRAEDAFIDAIKALA